MIKWNTNKLLEALKEHNPDIIIERKETKAMELTLSNGMKLTGTPEQVTAAAKALGHSVGNDGIWYNSSSRGLIRIVDMDDNHLQNALRKMHLAWAANLKNLTGIDLARALRDGCTDKTYLGLFTEYVSRVSRGKYR